MIEQKTFYKIVCLSGALLSMALFASIPSLVRGDWNFFDFMFKTYLPGFVFGAICGLPFWLVLKYVKRE